MKNLTQTSCLAFVLAAICLSAVPAAAQVAYLTPAQQKKELRKSLKDAKNFKSDYHESHLDVSAFTFKRGESGRRNVRYLQEQDGVLRGEVAATPRKKHKLKIKKR